MHVGALVLSCGTRPEVARFHSTAREGASLQKTTKIQREDTHRDRKRTKWVRERKKKSEILGGPAEGGPRESTNSNHNNFTTTTPPEMVCGPRVSGAPKGGVRKGGVQKALSPMMVLGLLGLGFRSECRSLGLWCLGFLGSENLGKTPKQ